MKIALTFFALLITSFATNAQAGPVYGMTCTKDRAGTSLEIRIKTGLFAPSTQQILQYDVTVVELNAHGERVSEKPYELESNFMIFDNEDQVREYLATNRLKISLGEGKSTDGFITVDVKKKTAVFHNFLKRSVESFTCDYN